MQNRAMFFRLMLVVCLAVIADDLESSDHFTNGEKTQYLSEDDASRSQLSRVHVADAAEEGFGANGVGHRAQAGADCSRVPEGVDQRLEV